MARKVYLVDTENVSSSWNMMLADMTKNDVLYLFYTEHSPGIGYADFKEIMKSDVQPEMISCHPGKNGLDFQLVSFMGYLIKSAPKSEYIIISNDNGFDSVIRFWSDQNYKVSRMTVYNLIQLKKARLAKERESQRAQEKTKQLPVQEEDMQKLSSQQSAATKDSSGAETTGLDEETISQDTVDPALEEQDSAKPISQKIVESEDITNTEKEGEETSSEGTASSEKPVSKKRGRRKKGAVQENAATEPQTGNNIVYSYGQGYMESTRPLPEQVDGKQLLSDLLADYDEIDEDTVIEVLKQNSSHHLQKMYTQMLKLFGHQAGVELYHVLKPHFSVLFTYAKQCG